MGCVSCACNTCDQTCGPNSQRVPGVPTTPRVWRVPTEFGSWPELLEADLCLEERTNDVGIALSGGGIRAACQGLGVLQALHSQGLLPKARYLSSNSGGSWVAAAYSYLPEGHGLDTFLGPPLVGPAGLTPAELRKVPPGSFAKALADARQLPSLCDTLVGDLPCIPASTLDAWSRFIAATYLTPFRLGAAGSVVSSHQGSSGWQRAVQAVEGTGAVVLPARLAPFSIINASARVGCEGKEYLWLPMEFTPAYCGVASAVAVNQAPACGGLVEPFGADAPAPAALPGHGVAVTSGETVEVTPSWFAPLAVAPGASSAAGAAALSPDGPSEAAKLGEPLMSLWSAADIRSKNDGLTVLGDGAATDNSAIAALLRRGLGRVYAHISAGTAINDPNFLKNVAWFPALFGQGPSTEMQVFKSGAWAGLFAQMKLLADADRPILVERELAVVDNPRLGVRGGWQVRVLWHFPVLSFRFRSQLPKATACQLGLPPVCNQGSRNKFNIFETLDSDFPYDALGCGDFSAQLVRLLAENTAWTLMEGMDGLEVRRFFS